MHLARHKKTKYKKKQEKINLLQSKIKTQHKRTNVTIERCYEKLSHKELNSIHLLTGNRHTNFRPGQPGLQSSGAIRIICFMSRVSRAINAIDGRVSKFGSTFTLVALVVFRVMALGAY